MLFLPHKYLITISICSSSTDFIYVLFSPSRPHSLLDLHQGTTDFVVSSFHGVVSQCDVIIVTWYLWLFLLQCNVIIMLRYLGLCYIVMYLLLKKTWGRVSMLCNYRETYLWSCYNVMWLDDWICVTILFKYLYTM